jgi:hypothetical protein
MKEKILVAVMFGLLAGMVLAQSGNLPAQDIETGTCQESKTVFLDVSRMGRKHSAAKNMSEEHEKQLEDGWSFVDLELYNENSDLEGFFLTYSRDIACPEPAA